MQSECEMGSDELSDDSGATDSCAYCVAENKLQQALYYCFQCGPFGRYMCGNCNRQHKKFAYMHDVRSVSAAAQLLRVTHKRSVLNTEDEDEAIDICAHCAANDNIQPASVFCFHCGPFGRYLCESCNKKEADSHNVRHLPSSTQRPGERFFSGKVYKVAVAINIGTTYSGYAFSTSSEFRRNPVKVSTETWVTSRLISPKTPTCVLFDKDQRFHSFGFDAEDAYSELILDNTHKDYYFFRGFKMMQQPKRDLQLEEEMGKKMYATTVFSACIKFLREHCEEKILKHDGGITNSDISWVITIPATWSDTSIQFMRDAAITAGIGGDELRIFFEPYAVHQYCRYLSVESLARLDGEFYSLEQKSKYLILNAGGNEINITIHEVNGGDSCTELYKDCINLGSTCLDKAFRNFLASIVGKDVMENFQYTNNMDYVDLIREFEAGKKTISNKTRYSLAFRVPMSLSEDFENARGTTINDHLKTTPEYNGEVTWINDKLRIKSDVVKGMFQETCDSVANHMKSVFGKPTFKHVPTILMVGGFSESPMLQDVIKRTFPKKRIIIPDEAGQTVLKGAVMLGHSRLIALSVVAKYTFGVETSVPFKKGVHPESNKMIDDSGQELCTGIFDKLIEQGQTIIDVKRFYYPTKADQKEINVSLYFSEENDPVYVSSCKLIGNLIVELERSGLNRSITVLWNFSSRNNMVSAVANTSTGAKARLTFFDYPGY